MKNFLEFIFIVGLTKIADRLTISANQFSVFFRVSEERLIVRNTAKDCVHRVINIASSRYGGEWLFFC